MKKYDVFLSPLAERKLIILLDYLTKEWGVNSKNKYLSKFKNAINQISTHPKSCPESLEMKGLYKCVLTKQSSFYYRIRNDEIEIITFFDNRQDQSKIFKEIKGNLSFS
ncbi:plasmid stabilization system protein [bacterium BMS3Abin03]|nr:plasmid stabilization system protein [bacterium BMS3Abin03]